MHDLIPLGPALPSGLTVSEIDATMEFAAAEKSPATLRAYGFDYADFAAWCLARGACPLPAHQGVVAAYLSSLARLGRTASTIGRRAAAIAWKHKLAGHGATHQRRGREGRPTRDPAHDRDREGGQVAGHG